MRKLFFLFPLVLLCASLGARAEQLQVVTSFSILADLVEQVGGERVNVHSFLGPGEEAHHFQPSPSDARLIREADLVVANGLGFDDWLVRLSRSVDSKKGLVIVSDGIRPLGLSQKALHRRHGHGHGTSDPHAWQDVGNVRRYVANIANALIVEDPAGAGYYHNNAERYDHLLQELDLDIRTALNAIPKSHRKVVTAHDAFGYFAHAYDVQFMSPVGVADNAEPSAKAVAALIDEIRDYGVNAVFLEDISDPRLLEQISRESGARIGGVLFSDALSDRQGSAPDYLSMMRHNLNALIKVLSE